MGEFINFIEDMYLDIKKNWKIYLVTFFGCTIIGTLLGLFLSLFF